MRGIVALLAVLATVSHGVPTHAASGDSAAAAGLLLRGQGAQGRGRISAASSSSSLSSASVDSVAWPGWPDDDDDDQDGPLLPMHSGDVVNLQWQAGSLFCNTQDVDMSELQTGGSTTNTNGVVRNVLVCGEDKAAGPREGLLVFGKDFMSNKIKEGGAFYLKAQRVAKFCAPRALGGGGPLVVVCDKLHYDPSCEWVAHLPEASDAQHAGKQADGDDAPAVIYLSPAKAKGGKGRREPRPLGCAPLGPHGTVVCDEGIHLRDDDAALLVVKSDGGGYQVARGGKGKGKGKGDEPAKLPFRTGSNVVLTSPHLKRACDTVDNPPYPYVRTSTADDELYEVYSYGPDSYGPDSYGPGATGDDADGGGYYPYPSGGGGRGGRGGRDSPEQYAVYCNASIPDDKSSPWPYTAGAAGTGTGTAADEQQGVQAAAVTAAVGRKGLIGADRVQSYGSADVAGGAVGEGEQLGGNSQWDLAGFVLLGTDFTSPDVYDGSAVFLKNQNARKMCRVVTKDEADELAAAAAAEEEADGAEAAAAAEAELDGAAQDEGGVGRRRRHRPTLVAGQVVCDQMRSSKKTEFVIELVESRKGGRGKRSSSSNGGGVSAEEEEEVAEAAGGGGEDAAAAGGGGNWPSGDDRHDGGRDSGDDWPGKRGKDGKAVHVEVRLRAPGNGMRYCAPDRRLRGSPMLCDLRPSDLDDHKGLAAAATFRLVDATPSHPWGPPV